MVLWCETENMHVQFCWNSSPHFTEMISVCHVSGRDKCATLVEEIILSVPCVCVCLSASTLTANPFDLWLWFLAWKLTLTLARMGLKVMVIGQVQTWKLCFSDDYQNRRSRSPRSRSRSVMKVTKIKVKDYMCMVKVTKNKVKVIRRSFLPPSTCGRFDTRAFSFEK